MFDPLSFDLAGLAAGLEAGTCSSRALTEWYLDRIRRMDRTLNAFVLVDEAAALKLADAADSRRAAGYRQGVLDGLPLAVKDLCDIEGRVTAAGSRAWSDRRAQRTAPVIRYLIAAGMIVIGKTQMVEFAFGGWGTNPHLGTPLNPWDLDRPRIPGGSSSGSAVAVAAGLVPAALGSDTGGSIRIPAAANGVTGLKISRGQIDSTGTLALAPTLDTLGFLARTAEDTLLLSEAACSRPPPLGSVDDSKLETLAGIRIAVLAPADYPVPVHDEVRRVTHESECAFRALGAQVETATIPFDFARLMAANGVITAAEAYALHRDHIEDDSLPFGVGVRRRILSGKAISAAAYLEALDCHRAMQAAWRRWSKSYHALLTPCLADPPLPLTAIEEDLSTPSAFTRAGNFVDATGLALPAGFCAQGLPIGVQLLGAPASQSLLVAIGAVFQRATDWHLRRPDLRALDAIRSMSARRQG